MFKTAKVIFDDNDIRSYDYYFDTDILHISKSDIVLVDAGDKLKIVKVVDIVDLTDDACKPILLKIDILKAKVNGNTQEQALADMMTK